LRISTPRLSGTGWTGVALIAPAAILVAIG
jgi:hypothetical protein